MTLKKRKKKPSPANRGKTGKKRRGGTPPVEHRWQPGQSGNPSGRPKTKLITQAFREILEQLDPKEKKTLAQLLARNAVNQALGRKQKLKGNLAALKEIIDRTEGKAVQPLSHSGLGSEPLTINVLLGRHFRRGK